MFREDLCNSLPGICAVFPDSLSKNESLSVVEDGGGGGSGVGGTIISSARRSNAHRTNQACNVQSRHKV